MSFPTPFIKNLPYSLPILSGLLLVLCQPPVSLSPLAYVALVPVLLGTYGKSLRRSFMDGYVAGIVAFTGLVYWVVVSMNTYGGLTPALSLLVLGLLVLYLALYMGAFTLSVVWLHSRGIDAYLTAPLVWVILEYIRGILLSGFPWSYLGHSQYNFLALIQVTSITGSYFLSFLIVAVNGIVASILRTRRVPWPFLAFTAVLIVVTLAFGLNRMTVPEKGNLKAAIVQGNMPQDVKWDAAFKAHTINTYRDLTVKYGPGASLVVWPETAMPLVFDHDPARQTLLEIPVAIASPILFGTIGRDYSDRYYNAAAVIGTDGRVLGMYNKVHLVPFGEFTPLVAYLPFLRNISVQIGDFHSGESHKPIPTDAGALGVLICFEGVFPSITNETVRQGANVLVNITNDAWFGRTSAPYQHLSFYVFRAVETDRWVLRSANTGVSAIIDPQGRIRSRTGLFEKTVLTGQFAMKQSQTFYVRHGDYFVLLVVIALLSLALYTFIRKPDIKRLKAVHKNTGL
jgi:apolipoprotein N-acyltransferase